MIRPLMPFANLDEARRLFGDRLIDPAAIASALPGTSSDRPPLPFTTADLHTAAAAGEILIYRSARVGDAPLTIVALIKSMPQAFDAKLLQTSGYQLKNEWGIELEPLATKDTCEEGWALFQPQVLASSCNRTFPEQEQALRAHEQRCELPVGSLRRRTAVEAVFDTALFFAVRGVRLLERSWDWTSSATVDGGLLQVGGFGPQGMQVVGYSPGVRHGALGVCPTRQPKG